MNRTDESSLNIKRSTPLVVWTTRATIIAITREADCIARWYSLSILKIDIMHFRFQLETLGDSSMMSWYFKLG